MNTRYSTFGYKTGADMDTYLGEAIKDDDVNTFGTYDKDTDEVTLNLCPKACGGPIIGHLEDENGDCKRNTSPDHEDLTKDESQLLIDNIKNLPNWTKAKMMWITDKVICTCDMCNKKCPTMFHLYDHMKNDHKILEKMILPKLMALKSKVIVPNSLEYAIKMLALAQSQNTITQNLFFEKMANTEDKKTSTSDNKSNIHLQKPQFVPEWTKFQKYEIFKENLLNWDTEHSTLSDSNKFGKVMMSITKNKEIQNLSKLASGKISETLMNMTDKTVPKIIELLDEKFLQTKSEKTEILAQEFLNFKLSPEDTAEDSWDKFCKIRSSLIKEKVIKDLFLHTIFFNLCVKSQKIKRPEEDSFRDLLEEEDDNTIHQEFKKLFSKKKLIGRRAATNVANSDITESTVLLGEESKEDEDESVHYGDQSRGRSQFRGKKRFYRSNSKPNFYKFEERSKSKFQHGRDQSPGGGRFRPSSQNPGFFRSRSQFNRNQSVDRRISPLEKKVDEIKQVLDDLVKKLPTDIKLVQDEINQIYLMHEGSEQYMLIDCGDPRTLIGRARLLAYLKSQDFLLENLESKAPEVHRFKFGETIYNCKEIVKIPIKIEDIQGKMNIILIDVHVVDGEVPFLFGKDTGELWEANLNMKKETLDLKFSANEENTFPCPTIGSHYKIRLHDLQEWDLPETVKLVETVHLTTEEKKEILVSYETIKKIHETTNHKNAENLMWAFKCADLMDSDLRKKVNSVISNCKVCTRFKKTFSRPKSTLPKSTEFNQIVTLDLKFFEKTPVLWMVDSCTRFIKGVVLKNKEAPTVITAIHEHWICNFGFPSIRFWSDNGTEFANIKLTELATKAGFEINYGPAYSPWSNGTNERNHASADIIVKKVMEEDKKITLASAVAMAGWTHNTNMNHSGFSPLQLVTGKSITIPGVTFSTPPSLSQFDADIVRNIIMNHCSMMKNYTSAEFTKKLFEVSQMRKSAYNDVKYSPGDKVYYQDLKDKAWYGPVKVVSHDSNIVFVLDRNTLKKLNTQRCMPYDERKADLSVKSSTETSPPGILNKDVPDEGIEATELEEEEDKEDPIAKRTRSRQITFEDQQEDLQNDIVGAYYINLPNKEDLTENSVYRVEIPVKQHG